MSGVYAKVVSDLLGTAAFTSPPASLRSACPLSMHGSRADKARASVKSGSPGSPHPQPRCAWLAPSPYTERGSKRVTKPPSPRVERGRQGASAPSGGEVNQKVANCLTHFACSRRQDRAAACRGTACFLSSGLFACSVRRRGGFRNPPLPVSWPRDPLTRGRGLIRNGSATRRRRRPARPCPATRPASARCRPPSRRSTSARRRRPCPTPPASDDRSAS